MYMPLYNMVAYPSNPAHQPWTTFNRLFGMLFQITLGRKDTLGRQLSDFSCAVFVPILHVRCVENA